MAQTVSNLTSILKEVWTSDRLQKQFYNENPFLERVEKFKGTMIGKQAQVPVHGGRSGGYTSTDSAGGSLNSAGQQEVDQAYYTLVYHWFQVSIQTGALNQTGNNAAAIVSAKDLEIQGAIDDLRRQCTRQIASNGDGLIAQCTTTSASATVNLLTTGFGPDAIVRGWLYPGLTVDVGTSADSDSVVTGAVIQSVDEANSTITLDSSITTTSSHYVSIANPNSATARNTELNGLRNIVATSGALGNLNPSTAGQEYWKAANVDSTSTTLSLQALLDVQRQVFQKAGKNANYCVTSLKQQAAFYSLLQNQVRFTGDATLGAGSVDSPKWNGMEINGLPDIVDREWYTLTIEDFIRIHGDIDKPTWASDIAGQSTPLTWSQGTTSFVDGVVYPFQLGVQRRNSHAALTGLTA